MVTTLLQDIEARPDGPSIEHGDIFIDAARKHVFRSGIKISLKPMEYKTLLALMLAPDRIFSGRELYEKAVGRPIHFKPSNVAAVHVSAIRKQFPGLNVVNTLDNDGYKLGTCREGPVGDFRRLRRQRPDGGACMPVC